MNLGANTADFVLIDVRPTRGWQGERCEPSTDSKWTLALGRVVARSCCRWPPQSGIQTLVDGQRLRRPIESTWRRSFSRSAGAGERNDIRARLARLACGRQHCAAGRQWRGGGELLNLSLQVDDFADNWPAARERLGAVAAAAAANTKGDTTASSTTRGAQLAVCRRRESAAAARFDLIARRRDGRPLLISFRAPLLVTTGSACSAAAAAGRCGERSAAHRAGANQLTHLPATPIVFARNCRRRRAARLERSRCS